MPTTGTCPLPVSSGFSLSPAQHVQSKNSSDLCAIWYGLQIDDVVGLAGKEREFMALFARCRDPLRVISFHSTQRRITAAPLSIADMQCRCSKRSLLTGIHDGAMITLRLKRVDVERHLVAQNPNEVATRCEKRIDTYFSRWPGNR